MPANPTELERIDRAIRVQLDLLRHSANVEAKVLTLLEAMRKELIAQIAVGDLTNWGKARLNTLLRETEATIAQYYAQAQAILAPTYSTVAGISAAQTATALAASVPSKAVLNALVSDLLIEGSPAKAWWSKIAADTSFRFAASVRQGIAQGETMNQIFKRVNETVDLAGRNSVALVHTSVMQVMNDARITVQEANADDTTQTEFLATLDSHTCWSGETLILMADGTQKPAGEIMIGDIVIGGISGEPCTVVSVMQKEVVSSVAIHYNGNIIGRVTHDHPVLTRNGWKEIGSVSLSADVSEREVLCRSFMPPEKTSARAPEICGGWGGIRSTQCNPSTWNTDHDDTRDIQHASGSVCGRDCADQSIEYEGSKRLQHDGWRRGVCRKIARIISSAGRKAFDAIQNGCGVSEKTSRRRSANGASTSSEVERVLAVGGREKDDSSTKRESRMEGKEFVTPPTETNEGRNATIQGSGERSLAGCRAPGKGECCAGEGTGGIARHESRMGCQTCCEDVCFYESEVERSRILGKDESAEAAYTIRRITRESCGGEAESNDTRKEGSGFREDAPILGEAEGVESGVITGILHNAPVVVFNFEVADDHSYVAGGIIVHNCTRCAPRDGLRWYTKSKKPVGHTLEWAQPPIHMGCRCTTYEVGVLTDMMKEAGGRASQTGVVKGTTTFAQYLERQTPAFQNEVLGAGRADLFRRGKITLRDLVSGRGAPISLKQLQQKYA